MSVISQATELFEAARKLSWARPIYDQMREAPLVDRVVISWWLLHADREGDVADNVVIPLAELASYGVDVMDLDQVVAAWMPSLIFVEIASGDEVLVPYTLNIEVRPRVGTGDMEDEASPAGLHIALHSLLVVYAQRVFECWGQARPWLSVAATL